MIKIRDLGKRYGDHVIFEHLNMDIEDGKLTAIAGGSGCGKSTLLNIIGLLDQDYSGSVEIDGVKLHSQFARPRSFFREKLGYLFQNYALVDNMSVSKNLDIALKFRNVSDKEDLKRRSLEKVGLDSEKVIHNKVYTLSGGEQQRVALARLLLKPCSIVLADEPTGSLDEKNRDEVLALLREMNQEGKTVIIVTHDLAVMRACDQVITIG